jgi:cysteine desulfurase
MIYLDNNATTEIPTEVFDAMRPFLTASSFGNPSAAYSLGSDARKAIDDGRASLAELLGAASADEIVFTSGGTESDNWAILGALDVYGRKGEIVTTRVEHEAVRKLCERQEKGGTRVYWVDVDESGELDINGLRAALTRETAVVSVMLANNETGVVFPVAEIAEIVKSNSNALFHVDGVNAAGKIPVNLKETEIDLFSISAHKFHGPKGIGALYIRDGVKLPSFLTGGGQEGGRRAGTEAVHQIAGLGAAAAFVKDLSPINEVRSLRDRLEGEILDKIPDSCVNGTRESTERLPNTSNISFESANGEMIMARLDALRVCVSTGSACNSQDHAASHVLQAMNVPFTSAMGAVRFSLGRFNTVEEVDQVLEALPGIVEEVRSLSS